MIKIQYNSAELDALSLKFYKKVNNHFSIKNRIDAYPNNCWKPILSYCKTNFKELITGKPDRLEFHINQISPIVNLAKYNYSLLYPLLTPAKVHKVFKTEVLSIFNYDSDNNSFTKFSNGKLAYQHAQNLSIPTCLYCNAQFTFTIKKNDRKTRPHFDHFYYKAKYPFLALSFYNLIPACYVCNSSLKSSKDFLHSTHVHPFVESINELLSFRTNITSTDFLVNNQNFSIALLKNKTAVQSKVAKAKRNFKDFAITERYNFHKDYIGEIITKSHIYNSSQIKELFEEYEIEPGRKLFSSESEIIEMLMGNYIQETKFHKRILSKLTKDILEEFGIKV